MKKIYRVSVVVKNEHTTYIEAETKEEAAKKVQDLYSTDSDSIEYEWGATELSNEIYADDEPCQGIQLEPDYRGDAVKIAAKNEEAHAELECEYVSEDSNVCITHNKDH